MPSRLPNIGGDDGEWGTILNDFLQQSLTASGGVKDGVIGSSSLTTNLQNTINSATPNSRVINTSTGLTGGGDLSADRTLSVVEDSTTQKIEIANSSSLAGTRKRLNFVAGTNVTVSAVDDSANNKVDVTINSTAGGGSSVAYRENYQIATHGRSDFYGQLSPSSPGQGQLNRSFHKLAVDGKWIKLCYANQYKNDANGASITDTITVEAVVERTNSEPIRVRFNGQTSVTIPPYGMVYSDPIPLLRRASDTSTPFMRVRTLVSGTTWPRYSYPNTYDDYVSQSTGEYYAIDTLATLQGKIATVGTITGITTATADPYMYYPSKIVAAEPVIPTRPAIALIGDSIMGGSSGRADDGFCHRAIAEQYAWASFAFSGEQAVGFQYIHSELGRWQQVQGFTHAICNYGINDISSDWSSSVIKAALIRIWVQLRDSGALTWQTTITPRSNDGNGDSGATPNVVPFGTYGAAPTLSPAVSAARHATRIEINDWIRDGAPMNSSTFAPVAIGGAGGNTVRAGSTGHPLGGYIEVADTVETSRNSGLWNASYVSSDYLHPTNAGHDAMAVPVSAAIASFVVA